MENITCAWFGKWRYWWCFMISVTKGAMHQYWSRFLCSLGHPPSGTPVDLNSKVCSNPKGRKHPPCLIRSIYNDPEAFWKLLWSGHVQSGRLMFGKKCNKGLQVNYIWKCEREPDLSHSLSEIVFIYHSISSQFSSLGGCSPGKDGQGVDLGPFDVTPDSWWWWDLFKYGKPRICPRGLGRLL